MVSFCRRFHKKTLNKLSTLNLSSMTNYNNKLNYNPKQNTRHLALNPKNLVFKKITKKKPFDNPSKIPLAL